MEIPPERKIFLPFPAFSRPRDVTKCCRVLLAFPAIAALFFSVSLSNSSYSLYNVAVSLSLNLSLAAMTSTPTQPSLLWRTGSTVAFGATSILCRSFLLGLNNTETVGLDKFLEVLDARKDVEKRNRGLLTGISTCPSFCLMLMTSLCSIEPYQRVRLDCRL